MFRSPRPATKQFLLRLKNHFSRLGVADIPKTFAGYQSAQQSAKAANHREPVMQNVIAIKPPAARQGIIRCPGDLR